LILLEEQRSRDAKTSEDEREAFDHVIFSNHPSDDESCNSIIIIDERERETIKGKKQRTNKLAAKMTKITNQSIYTSSCNLE
jgi:hypothetical protein